MKTWWYVWLSATVFWIGETWYFGWGATPSCTAERVCDFIALLLFIATFIVWLNKRVVIIFIGDSKTTVEGVTRNAPPAACGLRGELE